MTDLLEVRGLTKRFGGLSAVSKLDLHVNEGEIVSIIGPNGAGKTTCFNAITGVYRPAAGTVYFDGKPLTKSKRNEITRHWSNPRHARLIGTSRCRIRGEKGIQQWMCRSSVRPRNGALAAI